MAAQSSTAGKRLAVGCAMWAHKGWSGRCLPRGLTSSSNLAAYATLCDAVEGNTTFYALPPEKSVASWAAQAPPTFRFVFKLPKEITHDRRLRDISDPLRVFLDRIEPLGGRAEQLAVQLPASFGPNDLDALSVLVSALPLRHSAAVEVRHPDFFREGWQRTALLRVLNDHRAELINLDARTLFASPPASDAERETWRVKPRVPVIETALTERPIIRFIGRDDVAATQRGWQPWIGVLADWLSEGRSPTVFVHTPDNVEAPLLSRRLHGEVGALVSDLQPPPASDVTAPTSSAETLF